MLSITANQKLPNAAAIIVVVVVAVLVWLAVR